MQIHLLDRLRRGPGPRYVLGALGLVAGWGWVSLQAAPFEDELAEGKKPSLVIGEADSGKAVRPVLNDASGLEDYLAYAALNNPGLEAAFHRWKAALERIAQARALPDPKLNYGYFIQEVETRVGPQRQRVGLSQMVPWLSKLKLRGQLAEVEAEARYREYQAAKLRLFRQVKDIWYELYYLGQTLTITRDNVSLMTHLESVAQVKYKAGGPLQGVVQAQVELGKLVDRISTLNDLRGPQVAKFNAVLNRAAEAPVAWPRPWIPVAYDFQEYELWPWLVVNNPDLQALQALTSREEKAVQLARKESYPDFNFGLDYIQTDSRPGSIPDNGKDPVIAMVTINIPLWAGRNRAGVHEAQARRESAEQTWLNQENILRSDLKMAAYQFRDAERKIDLYRNTLRPLAEKSLNVAQQSWEAGQSDFLGLIDAQRLLLQIQLEEQRSMATREQRVAELEMLIGSELPRAHPGEPDGMGDGSDVEEARP